jgi:hypothetical protein
MKPPAPLATARPRLRVIAGGNTENEPVRAVASGRRESASARAHTVSGRGGALVSVRPVRAGGRRFLSTALATAGAWLVEPAEPPGPAPESAAPSPARPRTVITVFGLAPGCGATVVARALAAELAARDPVRTAAVACEARASGIPLATQAASRLARALEDLPGAATRAVGRLCLVQGTDHHVLAESSRHLAPLVVDAGSVPVGGVPAAVADLTILVGTPAVEPALARAAAECLARMRADAIVVLNRARLGGDAHRLGGGTGPAADAALPLPDARVGAQLAIGGREARGELGRAIAVLADRCEGIP